MTLGPFEADYRVRFDEAGPDGLARASVLLRYAHDVAWRHSTALGFDRDWYLERGLVWLVRSIDLDDRSAPPAGATVIVDTDVTDHGRIWARRRSGVWAGERAGEPAATVVTDWVLVDLQGRPTRLPGAFIELFGSPPAQAAISKVELEAPPPDAARLSLTARHHELDPNGHVNNAVYLDWIDEGIRLAAGTEPSRAGIEGRRRRRYRVEYLAGMRSDEAAELTTWPAEDGWRARLRRAEDGQDLARARVDVGAARPSDG